jgi:hypothetical protein
MLRRVLLQHHVELAVHITEIARLQPLSRSALQIGMSARETDSCL